MANNFFKFKQFTVYQDRCAFKVGTDGVILGAYADVPASGRILDIGTGTGLIALMMGQRSNCEITAIEPDRESFQQACDNVESSSWHNRIRVLNTSLQDFDPGKNSFDLIVSNPPYFSESLRNPDPSKSAARHNFNLKNNDLLSGVKRLLSQNGIFQVIMPYIEGNILIAEASGYGLFCISLLKIRPLPTSEIRRIIITFSAERRKPNERFLTIEHGKRHEFTDEYITLTKEFYLDF
jgi:tRNA1Val (adenine37-N6)-methyltransferase